MQDFVDSPLLRDLAAVMDAPLLPSEGDDARQQRFACRPLAAYTSERCTVLGRFTGQIGLARVAEFKAAMNDLVEENVRKVILDFSHIALTRSAVGALVVFAGAMHGRNKRLYLFRCSDQVLGLLRELGLSRFFSFLENEDDVIATLVV